MARIKKEQKSARFDVFPLLSVKRSFWKRHKSCNNKKSSAVQYQISLRSWNLRHCKKSCIKHSERFKQLEWIFPGKDQADGIRLPSFQCCLNHKMQHKKLCKKLKISLLQKPREMFLRLNFNRSPISIVSCPDAHHFFYVPYLQKVVAVDSVNRENKFWFDEVLAIATPLRRNELNKSYRELICLST